MRRATTPGALLTRSLSRSSSSPSFKPTSDEARSTTESHPRILCNYPTPSPPNPTDGKKPSPSSTASQPPRSSRTTKYPTPTRTRSTPAPSSFRGRNDAPPHGLDRSRRPDHQGHQRRNRSKDGNIRLRTPNGRRHPPQVLRVRR